MRQSADSLKGVAVKIQLTHSSWEIDENNLLGKRGGFGAVYKGTGADSQEVAIKVLDDAKDGARELALAEYLYRLPTQHVIRILDFGVRSTDGKPCIVIPRAEKSLRDYITAQGKLSESEAVAIISQMATGLLEAGDAVHRDMKPENCLFESGRWQLSDFGIARMEDATTSLNTMKDAMTPQYAAPEQWLSLRATHATDVYALGCILAELIDGSRPFSGPSRDDYRRQHTTEVPKLTAGSPRVRSLLIGMLAKPHFARPTADDVVNTLQQIGVSSQAPGPGSSELLTVVSKIKDQQAREEIARLELEAKVKERDQTASMGFAVWDTILERFLTAAAACGVVARQLQNVHTFKLGEATLSIDSRQAQIIGNMAEFEKFEWIPYCSTFMGVGNKKYGRSARFVFASVKGAPPAWFEISAYRMANGGKNEPTGTMDDHFLAQAINPFLFSGWQLAHPPRPLVDDQQITAFTERWLQWLAQAADGTLSYPSYLPEKE